MIDFVRSPVLVLVLALVAPAARADDAAEALRRGVRLMAERRDAEARIELEKAYARGPTPEAAGQLGLVEGALGAWVAAEAHLLEALAAEKDPWVRRNRAQIERQLQAARAHLGTLVVTGSPEGAEVEVGGKRLGTLPLPAPLRVPAGRADVNVSAARHHPESRSVPIEAGVVQRATFALRPLPPPAPPPAVAAPPVVMEVAPAASPARAARLVGYVCAGLGLAALTSGSLWAASQSDEKLGGRLLAWTGAGLLVGGAVDVALSFTVLRTDRGAPAPAVALRLP